MKAEAVIFDKPGELRVGRVSLKQPDTGDCVVEMHWSGISTGTERLFFEGRMPSFPGLGYPLVPGYEGVGVVVAATASATDADGGNEIPVGTMVLVPGANCFNEARGLFGASASRVVVPAQRLIAVEESLGERTALLSLAATAFHAIRPSPHAGPTLVVGHGVLGRLIARLLIARGDPAPTVWEHDAVRRAGARGYRVTDAKSDTTANYATVIDVSGDARIIDEVAPRIRPQGEIVLAGFYARPVTFDFAPPFMREARIRIAAEWRRPDFDDVIVLVRSGLLSLDGLISHLSPVGEAKSAYAVSFNDPACTKMILDWRS